MKRFRLGVSFSDFVLHEYKKSKFKYDSGSGANFERGTLMWIGVCACFLVLTGRLMVLQIFQGNTYRILAEENRIKTVKVLAPRGEILDRNGKVIVGTKMDGDVWTRVYPWGESGSAITGYISQTDDTEVGKIKEQGKKYEALDMIGRSGLELQYEEMLRGMDGGRLFEVDTFGNQVRDLGLRKPVPGSQMKTSIDVDLQNVAYKGLMEGRVKKGGVVVSNPQTGEVLALVSAPGFDPNIFAKSNIENRESKQYQILNDEITKVLIDTNLPMFNRAIGGIYAPGSTFKLITTTAAIESGKVEKSKTIVDTGIITINGFNFSNWLFSKHGGKDGVVDFTKALQRSNDIFFYRMGEAIGPEVIGEWAGKLGLGKKTEIDLPGELEGVIASPDYKKRVTGEEWFLGNSYHMAIGQGDTLATPLQINLMTNILAAEGRKCPLKIAQNLKSKSENLSDIECSNIEISSDTLKIIKDGMIAACSSGGTAFPMFDWNDEAKKGSRLSSYAKATKDESLPLVACKTGTAEYYNNGKIKTHAWLTAFAPADEPRISVTALVEGGGEGSNAAAPIVRKVMAQFFGVEDTYPYGNIRGSGE